MFKKLGVMVGVLAIAGMAFGALASTASADEPTPTATPPVSGTPFPHRHTLLHGMGVLDAQGEGVAAVKGLLDLNVSASQAILLVKDEGGDAVVNVDGNGQTGQWRGFTAYFGFDGTATVTGKDVAVIVVGSDINLHVEGRGWAFLKGTGTFTANGFGPFPWTSDGAFGSVTP